MSEEIPEVAAMAIEKTRKLTRSLASKIAAKGIEPADIAIGVAYALHDIATEMSGSPVEAVEWMRSATDIMEQPLLDGTDETPTRH